MTDVLYIMWRLSDLGLYRKLKLGINATSPQIQACCEAWRCRVRSFPLGRARQTRQTRQTAELLPDKPGGVNFGAIKGKLKRRKARRKARRGHAAVVEGTSLKRYPLLPIPSVNTSYSSKTGSPVSITAVPARTVPSLLSLKPRALEPKKAERQRGR